MVDFGSEESRSPGVPFRWCYPARLDGPFAVGRRAQGRSASAESAAVWWLDRWRPVGVRRDERAGCPPVGSAGLELADASEAGMDRTAEVGRSGGCCRAPDARLARREEPGAPVAR